MSSAVTAVNNLTALQERHKLLLSPWVRKILWRRKWQPTSVVLPRKSHGQSNLASKGP